MGQARLLDNLLSKWDRLVYSTIYLLSKWDRLVYLCPIYTGLVYSSNANERRNNIVNTLKGWESLALQMLLQKLRREEA